MIHTQIWYQNNSKQEWSVDVQDHGKYCWRFLRSAVFCARARARVRVPWFKICNNLDNYKLHATFKPVQRWWITSFGKCNIWSGKSFDGVILDALLSDRKKVAQMG